MNASAAISIREVWKYFGDYPAVRDVSFDVAKGSITALLGRNGAGKTTLLRMIAGLARPSRGEVAITGTPAGTSFGSKLGVIGHGQWLYDDLTATENLQFFASLYDVADPAPRITQWLERVGLAPFHRSRVGDFSRGMRQRLAIARTFLHEPEILLLDEPWTALDDRAISLLSSLLTDVHKQQRTVLVCSHQLTETLDVATHIVVIDRGRLAFTGDNREEFKTFPQSFYQRVL